MKYNFLSLYIISFQKKKKCKEKNYKNKDKKKKGDK